MPRGTKSCLEDCPVRDIGLSGRTEAYKYVGKTEDHARLGP